MNNIAILGAGFSTSTLCYYLNEKDIKVFEKARGPGGRSSTRKVDDIGVFDHGLQYISPKDKKFSEFLKLNKSVKRWESICLVKLKEITKRRTKKLKITD